ncbi:HVO_2922 family protein [Haladaptatus cibarius]|uniref:HVO_2922 family protein n=1 Tax=Haladaptatus cibarius TaxID=453847 RepID=UPI00067846E9|nr:HVO_2922 family protein [Haladaptatus cibarius]
MSKATFELYQDAREEWRWRLVHDNGNIIADSGEGYERQATAEQGIESVQANASSSKIDILE